MNQHPKDLITISQAAVGRGFGFEIIEQRHFRNIQRFGARATESLLRFTGTDPQALEAFARSIYFT
ncbi:MAG: hypothetical protein WBP12_05230 [Candidatus Saccharimonas sp.]